MAKTRIVAAIELGSTKIATLVAQVQVDPVSFEQTINIVGAASSLSTAINRKGQIDDIGKVVEATISSVEAAERMAGYNLDSAFVALGGAHISSQNSNGVVAVSDPEGEILEDDVARAVEAASAISLPTSRELIHILPREYIVDGEVGVKDPEGMTGVRLEVETHLITASAGEVKNYRKVLDEVGIDIEGFVFSGLASAEAVLTPTEKELGCVCVDIGGETTSIAVFTGGALIYSGVVPIGGKNVTRDLAAALRISLEATEKIKIALSTLKSKEKKKPYDDQLDLTKLGISEIKKVSRRTLVEGIMGPRLNEIFAMVKLDLEKAELINKTPSGVVITGGAAENIGAMDSAKRMLSLPVRIGKPGGLGGLVDDILVPAFATPVGLIFFGAKQEPQEALASLAKRIRLPSKGVAGKLVEVIRDLLP